MSEKTRKLSENFIRQFFTGQYGLDIETGGAGVDAPSNILQIGIQDPTGAAYELNVLQQQYSPSRFHAREGGLHDYFTQASINPEQESSFRSISDEFDRRHLSAVVSKEKAKKLSHILTSRRAISNHAPNMIIHNAQFELRHFNEFFDGNSPFDFSENFKRLIDQNKRERWQDTLEMRAGRLTPEAVRGRDIARQTRLYEQIVSDAARGGQIIDTMEIAKTANALAQKRRLIPATGDLALGTNVEFLADTFLGQREAHRAVQDVAQQNMLAPKLVRLVEKLKDPNFKTDYLSESEKRWVNHFRTSSLDMKVASQRKSIQLAIDTLETGTRHKFASGRLETSSIDEFIHYLSRTGKYESNISQGFRVVDHSVSPDEIVSRALRDLPTEYRESLSKLRGGKNVLRSQAMRDIRPLGIRGGAVAAGLGLGALAYNRISGKDDEYNTIEGLPHGWYGDKRKHLTDFGSGYKGPTTSLTMGEPENPEQINYAAIALGIGGFAASRQLFHTQASILGRTYNVDRMGHLGTTPAGFTKMSEALGRETATYGDIMYASVRRLEASMGGIPKAFGVSTLMSPSVFRDTELTIDLTKKTSTAYRSYLNKLVGRDLMREGVTQVTFKNGQLFSTGVGARNEVLLRNASLVHAVQDRNIAKSKSQLAKSFEHILGSRGVGREHDFLITGGHSRIHAAGRTAHAYLHESLSKYFRLMDDPAGALRDFMPGVSPTITSAVEKATRYMPKMGVGGEQHLVGNVPQLMGRHARTGLPWLLGAPLAYQTASWAVRQLAPEDSFIGETGITGILAETARSAHMAYSNISELTGLTSLREAAEESAPGLTGVLPFLGVTLGGGLTGMFASLGLGVAEELTSGDPYSTFLRNKKQQRKLPGFLSFLPGMGGDYTRTGRWGRIGATAAAVAAAPLLLAGLGSSKRSEELDRIYSGAQDVAVRKGRFWEFGQTHVLGDEPMYYRPNWYARMVHRARARKEEGDPSPIGEVARDFIDPYRTEKEEYYDRPYPTTGPSGRALGIFGPLYERTLGQVLKPDAVMHRETLGGITRDIDHDTGEPIIRGSADVEAMPSSDFRYFLKQQWQATFVTLGLRGFAASALKDRLTGQQHAYVHEPVLANASEINSRSRAFWDENIGGAVGLSEPIRRFILRRPYHEEVVNPLPNRMPSWLPGEDYFINFQQGDPYTHVAEGEYRLPGRMYQARFPELRGVDPEDYPLFHRYRILADVAPYSSQYKDAASQLRAAPLTDEGQELFDRIESQVKDVTGRQFTAKEEYSGLFGEYARGLATIARQNPLEELTPLSPGHKFLPRQDVLSEYESDIFAKEFKLWQNPIDDFVVPFFTRISGHLGGEAPARIEEARQIDKYFDYLNYMKNIKLAEEAELSGDSRTANRHLWQSRQTLIGADPYEDDLPIYALPRRERDYVESLMDVPFEERDRVLDLAPDYLKDFYIAEWDKRMIAKIEDGALDISEEEEREMRRDIASRESIIRDRRRAAQVAAVSNPAMPGDDWEGWSPEVDLKDVKLRYLQMEGRDHHMHDLWEDRVRKTRRSHYLDDIAQDINVDQALEQKRLGTAEILEQMLSAGIQDPRVTHVGSTSGVTAELQYDRSIEEQEILRQAGYVL